MPATCFSTDLITGWSVGVDAQTGMILLLAEHVEDRITKRHAEATSVRLDEVMPDLAFTIHIVIGHPHDLLRTVPENR